MPTSVGGRERFRRQHEDKPLGQGVLGGARRGKKGDDPEESHELPLLCMS